MMKKIPHKIINNLKKSIMKFLKLNPNMFIIKEINKDNATNNKKYL